MISKKCFLKLKIVVSILLVLSFLSSYGFGIAGCVYAAVDLNVNSDNMSGNGKQQNDNSKNQRFVPTRRQLAIFTALTYANLEGISGFSYDKNPLNKLTYKDWKMVTDAQLKKLKTNTTVAGAIPIDGKKSVSMYDFWFNGLASTDEVKDWQIVNYAKCTTKLADTFDAGEFTAMTFKKGNTIVIAYRGTDMHDFMECMQDLIGYGLLDATGQEKVAQEYAKKVANQYKNCDIYVTGHSLGGYLAQIGAGAIVKNYNVKGVEYFNGIGMTFKDNLAKKLKGKMGILDTLSNLIIKDKNFKKNAEKLMTEYQKIHYNAKTALIEYVKNGGRVVSNYTKGDWVSMLGTHVGDSIPQDLYDPTRIQCNSWDALNSKDGRMIATALVDFLSVACNTNISNYIEKYKATGPIAYLGMTHKLDSFFGTTKSTNSNLEIVIEKALPSSLKKNTTYTMNLLIKMKNIKLKQELTTDSFMTSNVDAIKVTGVEQTKVIKYGSQITYYKYTIKITTGASVGMPSDISLKANALKLKGISTSTQGTSNPVIKEIIAKPIILDSTKLDVLNIDFKSIPKFIGTNISGKSSGVSRGTF